jgi:hypothetical protein
MPLTMRPTGLGAGIDKDWPDYTACIRAVHPTGSSSRTRPRRPSDARRRRIGADDQRPGRTKLPPRHGCQEAQEKQLSVWPDRPVEERGIATEILRQAGVDVADMRSRKQGEDPPDCEATLDGASRALK